MTPGTSGVVFGSFSVDNPNNVTATISQMELPLEQIGGSANAVARLRLFVDTNGNGQFDQGTDSLAGSLSPVPSNQTPVVTLSPTVDVPAGGSVRFIVLTDFN